MSTDLTNIGRYLISQLIGEGGMGALYLARDPAIDRPVAIKLIREGFDSDAARERFVREAQSAGRLRHPNIVTIFDVGEHLGRPFIAMEYIPGETLHALVRRRAVLPMAHKLRLIEDLCAGLSYAHRAGVVHRDIKPENVMVDGEGVLKILDFGIARVAHSGMTLTGEVMGTLNYMSPEQIAGKPVDRQSDVFAVGALFYELLTYQRAFPGDLSSGVVWKIIRDEPAPLESLCPDAGPDVTAIVARMLAKEPAVRYADLDRVRTDVVRARQRFEGQPVPTMLPGTGSTTIGGPPHGRSRKRILTLAAAAVSALAMIGLWVGQSERTALKGGVLDPNSQGVQPEVRGATPQPAPPTESKPEPAAASPPAARSTSTPRRELPSVGQDLPATRSRSATASAVAVSPDVPLEGEPPQRSTPEPTRATVDPVVEPPIPPPATSMAPVSRAPPTETPSDQPAPRPPGDEVAIREVLRQYEAAYESLDASAVRRVWPSLGNEEFERLAKSFAAARSFHVEIENMKIALDGDVARVSCRVQRQYVPKVGQGSSNTVPQTFELRRDGTGWRIQRMF